MLFQKIEDRLSMLSNDSDHISKYNKIQKNPVLKYKFIFKFMNNPDTQPRY